MRPSSSCSTADPARLALGARGSRLESFLSPTIATSLLLLSALLFGVMAFVSKLAMVGFDGPAVAAARFMVGLVLSLAVLATRWEALRPRRIRLLSVRGLLGGVAVLLYFLALQHLPIGIASLLNYSSPVFTVFVARAFLGERLRAAGFGSLALAVTGVTLVVIGQPASAPDRAIEPLWVIVGLASAFASAGAVTSVRALRTGGAGESAWSIFAFFCGFGLLWTAPAARVWHVPSAWEAFLLVSVGLLAMIAQVIMNSVMRWVPAAYFGITAQLSVVSAMVLGVLFLGEPWSALTLVGALLAFIGVGWAARLGPAGAA